ncbi:Nn.00g098520.m01.CDS01 [Neocucurbitaria sp. VM-36]
MQNYGQPLGYQRPGSTASFAGQQGAPAPPPPPPGYGASQGYQSVAPQTQSQWAAPTPTPTSNPQWPQPQQAPGGYQPSTYGVMPGGYTQGQQASSNQPSYPSHQHDKPPPPPPKPYGFAGAVQHQQQQQNTQNWSQPGQQTGFTPQTQQGGYPVQGTPQQPYSNAAPPPPSATPGGSYFPPSQGDRPGSVYGASQVSSYSNSPSAGPQQPSTVASPNDQQPVYIPPSLTGQGVQAYMPSNTNPAPGVYVPPPPDVPAWQQAQHAPLQGGVKKFRYTKPTVDPSFYAQGYQGIQPMQQQPPQPQGQFGQSSTQPPQFQQQSYGQPAQTQFTPHGQAQQQQNQFGQAAQPQQQPLGQPVQPQNQFQQQPVQQPQYNQTPQGQQTQQATQYPQQQNTQVPYGDQPSFQQPQWQPAHQAQDSLPGQQYPDQGIQAPKPLSRTDTASSTFFNQPSPQSQPVSPVNNRQSMSFGAGHQAGVGRAGSVSSIALANLHSQRADNRTSSPRPAPPKLPTPPPPRDDKSKFSALGAGGPSDWERFGDGDEIDDEELFAKKDEKKDEPNELGSVELPAHVPSPPSTHGWPSPATHPINSTLDGRKDTYAPTPPLTTASPAQRSSSQPPQQTFIMGDGAVAPLRSSPKPTQSTQPPPTQRSFVMDDSGWAPPKQSTPTQQESQHQAPPQQGFVMDDGGWAAQSVPVQVRQHTPAEQHHQPPPVQTGLVVSDGGWGASQQTPTQASGSFGAQSSIDHAAELKVRDDALERLRTESEKEKGDLRAEVENKSAEIRAEMEKERTRLRAEMEKLKADVDNARNHAAAEANTLHKQIEAMNVATEQAKTNVDASIKEKDILIERLKEDVEGKEHNIEERDATILDLRRQLEAEKTKELPKPAPADLIPDIDPWYIGSLERYISMLRSEAHEPEIENKIKTFRAFMRAESTIRGIEFYDAPPPALVHEPLASHQPEQQTLSRNTSNGPTRKRDLNVQVPQGSPTEEYDYSPGGRPVLRQQAIPQSNDNVPNQQHVDPSGQSTTILTPTSSIDDDSKKTPVQSPPEDQSQRQYKAYVPPAAVPSDPAPLAHRSTMSVSIIPAVATPSGPSKSHDEIFFGAAQSETSNPVTRPTSSDSTAADIPIPAPLSFTSNRPISTTAPLRAKSSNTLADILPAQTTSVGPNRCIEEFQNQIAGIKPDPNNLEDLTKTWEKAASLSRRKNDDARRKRQEENEEHNDDLFNNNEISYAEMNQLEDDFKQKEGELKAQEDRDEYESYVQAVFDTVYDGLQADIKALMDIYIEVENQLHSSVSGVKSLEGNDTPSTKDCLELLKDLHERIEAKHEKVVHAVAERDKRYKKTEIQPLYAAGNIVKMKSVERHFENAEKQSVVRAKREKAERIGELVNIAEDIVVRAVGVEQGEIDQIIAAIKELDDGEGDAELLSRAHSTLTTLKSSSKTLLSLFNTLEIELNDSVLDAEVAEAKAGAADAAKIQGLESEKAAGAKKMTDEYERRVGVLEQDEEEIRALVQSKGAKVELTEEQEREMRLKAALEEAKRRNGHA